MLIKDFMDILAWQKAEAFAVQTYASLDSMQEGDLKNKILQSVVEIPASIAAGFERRGLGDFKEFLYVAKTKIAYVRTLLAVAKDSNTLETSIYDDLMSQSEDVSKLIYGFIKTFIDKTKKPSEK